MMRKMLAAWLMWLLTFAPTASWAGRYSVFSKSNLANVPANTLPAGFDLQSGKATASYAGNTLTVKQKSSKAIIDWESFNIGRKATTYFDQQGKTNWAALNRIHQNSPSQILGQLKADGKVYLINQNGVLFGPESQVNVYSLTASTLNISDTNFLNNNLTFQAENYADIDGDGELNISDGDYLDNAADYGIRNQGIIAVEQGGQVFLLGQKVVNEGDISAYAGQIGLAAGTEFTVVPLENKTDPNRIALGNFVKVAEDGAGEVINEEGASLTADLGLIGMYGSEITQDGIAVAETSPEIASRIEMMASKLVSTGKNSFTGTPIIGSDTNSESEETYIADEDLLDSATVYISGLINGEIPLPTETVKRVVHRGTIYAPSGDVKIRAEERVYLDSGSKIDVSGLEVDQEAEELVLEVTLNSLELRDYFAQKGGVLQGEKIRFLITEGSAIGDISGALNTQESTAAELATSGGTIEIYSGVNDPTGQESGRVPDIIVREGAELDFSGGGIHYEAGTVEITGLVNGNTVTNIAEASPSGRYSAMANVWKNVPSFFSGSDAGTLRLVAPCIVLDGNLNGSVTVGPYQLYDDAEKANGLLSLLRPKAGTLELGQEYNINQARTTRDAIQESITIVESNTALTDFTADDELDSDRANVFSAEILNEAGLGTLKLTANTEFHQKQGADLELQAGGELTVAARRIVEEGKVYAPGGEVNFTLVENLTSYDETDPRYKEQVDRFYLGPQAVIDVSGEQIDNRFLRDGEIINHGFLNGGSVTIKDWSDPVNGMILAEGSRIDVGGGYEWSTDDDLEGGDAGSLSITGDTLFLDGEMTGLALAGQTGGTLTLHASDVTVTSDPHRAVSGLNADSELPIDKKGLVLSTGQLTDSGFTHINLKSVRDLVVERGVHLQPSHARLQPGSSTSSGRQPRYSAFSGSNSNAWQVQYSDDGRPLLDDLGASSINLASGKNFTSGGLASFEITALEKNRTLIERGAEITVGPKGAISVSGLGVEIDGVLDAPAGSVAVTATSTDALVGTDALILGEEARILAQGWNEPGSRPVSDLPRSHTPHDGGSVTLTSEGTLRIAKGAKVDASAAPVTKTSLDGYRNETQATVSGNPGQVYLSFADRLELDGRISAQATWLSGRGGELTVTNSEIGNDWALANADFEPWIEGGFDAITLLSYSDLIFDGKISASVGRSLVIDAPRIVAGDDANISLSAPWVRLMNTYYGDSDTLSETGGGRFSLAGEWIDLVGDLQLSGFDRAYLLADSDLRVSDFDYQNGKASGQTGYKGWSGRFSHSGDLVTAGRIVAEVPSDVAELAAITIGDGESSDDFSPVFAADFTFDVDGKITTLQASHTENRILSSAGGSVTLNAGGGIEHYGTIEVPYGSITLNADDGRVLLANGSQLITSGTGAAAFGTVKDGLWFKESKDKNVNGRTRSEIEGALDQGVAVTGDQVLMAEGALIDVSGGGAVFGYQFQPGVDGSTNPLNDKLIVVADPDLKLPGEAIYLEGVDGVDDGVYSIVSEEYALVATAYAQLKAKFTLKSEQQAELAAEYQALSKAAKISPEDYGQSADEYRAMALEYSQQAEQYNLMAAEYAELPDKYDQFANALVLTDLGSIYQSAGAKYTEEGYTIVGGSQTWQGTEIDSAALNSYAVRSLSDVLQEGSFEFVVAAQGDAGDILLQGETTIVNGTLLANQLDGLFNNGSLKLAGDEIIVTKSAPTLPKGFAFDDDLPAKLLGTLQVDGTTIVGFSDVELGDLGITSTVTLEEGSSLQAERITLAGSKGIYLKRGSTIETLSDLGKGEATFISPDGKVVLEEGVLVHASDALSLSTNDLDLQGGHLQSHFQIDNSRINLLGDRIVFVEGNEVPAGETGLFITKEFWSLFAGLDNVGLESGSDVEFQGDFDLAVANLLSFDTARIVGNGGNVNLTAGTISLGNSGDASSDDSLTDSGTLAMAADSILFADGDTRTDGFKTIDMTAAEMASVTGDGSLTVDGTLTVSTPLVKVTGTGSTDAADAYSYHQADYLIDGGTGTVSIQGTGAVPDISDAGDAGGRFEIAAGTINHSGIIDNTAGTTVLSAVDDVRIGKGGQILARGNDSFAAGAVQVTAETGTVELADGSLIDVSGGAQGDAGSIELAGAVGGVTVAGDLKGTRGAKDGRGGSFDLESASVADFSTLNAKLKAGGFDERIAVRARTDNLTINDEVTAQEIYLAADDGDVTLSGTLDASGFKEGGTVELHAGQDLTLADGSLIDVSGGEEDGSVTLNSRDGWITMAPTATIDIGAAEAGDVLFRAGRDAVANDTRMDLQGVISGTGEVTAEGVESYTVLGTLNQTTFNGYQAAAQTWVTNSAALFDNLEIELAGDVETKRRAGIEIQSDGDLTISSLNLKSSSVLGNLTVRADGDLTVAGTIQDVKTTMLSGFTSYYFLNADTVQDSWGISLVAGADGGAADPTATVDGSGDLDIQNGRQIYSESGDISLAAGNDMVIGTKGNLTMFPGLSIPYSVASHGGSVQIRAGKDLTLDQAIVQTATGDIDMQIAGDLNMDSIGNAVRTLGERPTPNPFSALAIGTWNFADGGDIRIDAGGAINGSLSEGAWDSNQNNAFTDNVTIWVANYQGANTTLGLATLSGGNLSIRAGGDFFGQAGTFGSGDLSVMAGGDIRGVIPVDDDTTHSSRFLNHEGTAEFQALGNIGAKEGLKSAGAVFEIFDTDLQVTSQGNLYLAAIVDPLVTRDAFNKNQNTLTTGYTTETRAALRSLTGDVVLDGDSPFYNEGGYLEREQILPASLEIAAGRDIFFDNGDDFVMLPSADGNLSLIAGRDIRGIPGSQESFSGIIMTDYDPAEIYGRDTDEPNSWFNRQATLYTSELHEKDSTPVVVQAGRNIETIGFMVPKMAQITAGNDIRFIQYVGQQYHSDDVSIISAGNLLEVQSGLDSSAYYGIEQGGPGSLIVQAGYAIDLGSSKGIVTYGSENNPALGTKGSDLLVKVGYDSELTLEEAAEFFSQLKAYGEAYAAALNEDKTAEATAIANEARSELIEKVLGSAPNIEDSQAGKGELKMVESLIKTAGGADDIYIITAGDFNVGRTSIGDSEENTDTGVTTARGGDISIFCLGDLNVYESRVKTFLGSDILVWSDQGNINAGRGSRTAVSQSEATLTEDEDGNLVVIYAPPAVGSGIGATTYDPDGAGGPLEKPEQGNISLIAPEGIIDAGEAGITGGNILLAATEVRNAQNISFSIGSTGVPSSSGSTGLGSLAGTTALSEVGGLVDQASSFGPRQDMTPTQVVDDFVGKWLDVEVVGFVL